MRSAVEALGSPIELRFTLNGRACSLHVAPLRRLLDALREELGLTGTKEGCGEGECGACTVLVDGEATLACLVPCCQVQGADVRTVEGPGLDGIRAAFLSTGGAQCGICTPGMITMTAAWLERCRREGTPVTLDGARTALAGNLCRCTGYTKILEAALVAAREHGLRVESKVELSVEPKVESGLGSRLEAQVDRGFEPGVGRGVEP